MRHFSIKPDLLMCEKLKPTLLKYDVPVHLDNKEYGAKTVVIKKKIDKNSENTEKITRDVLNEVLPPRKFMSGGRELTQFVSTIPSTRSDVIKLQQQLDSELQKKKARETGICPLRSELYGQCFDEIIRQVTIDCSARGLLLVKVRNEMRSIIREYQQLYESALTWGMNKSMEVERNKNNANSRNATLREEIEELKQKNAELEQEIIKIMKKNEEQRRENEKAHNEEKAFLRRQIMQLKSQLEQILTSK